MEKNDWGNLVKDGVVESIEVTDVSQVDDSIIIDLKVVPKTSVRHINTSFTITKDGVEFNEE